MSHLAYHHFIISFTTTLFPQRDFDGLMGVEEEEERIVERIPAQ